MTANPASRRRAPACASGHCAPGLPAEATGKLLKVLSRGQDSTAFAADAAPRGPGARCRLAGTGLSP